MARRKGSSLLGYGLLGLLGIGAIGTVFEGEDPSGAEATERPRVTLQPFVDADATTRPATARPATAAPATAKPPAVVYYENCTAVREAGKDPIRRGDPGYADHLDRDGDGIACE
jgi:hypothetical protein